MKILIVDDEPLGVASVQRLLRRRGPFHLAGCSNAREAVDLIKTNDFAIVLLDLMMPDLDGLQVLELTKPFRPATEFIILTALDEVASAVKALRLGAYDYLVKPVDPERLWLSIERAYERRGLRAGLAGTISGAPATPALKEFAAIITQNRRLQELLAYAQVMARSGIPILISGESGTGKELLARALHRAGPHPQGPFVAVNLASVPNTLFESLFFGYLKGAFTGADRNHHGYFEQAQGGTLFLDEIGELPLPLQPKLLRVLEDKSLQRLGDAKPIDVDVRLLSATNRDLNQACQEGKFRLDLFYRLQSAHIHLPPLREREGDIPLLAHHFLRQAAQRHHKDVEGFSPDSLTLLSQMAFPGNVRELAQSVERAVLVADTPWVQPQHLGPHQPPAAAPRALCSLKDNAAMHIAYVLSQTKGDRKKTAAILGITLRQLQRKLAEMRQQPRWSAYLDDI